MWEQETVIMWEKYGNVVTQLFCFLLLLCMYPVLLATEGKESVSTAGIVRQDMTDEVRPVVALTFDDGPSGATTPFLLDGLKERKVRATFFLIGENIEKGENAAIVKRMYEEGHVVGNHTYTHCNLSELETAEAQKELEMTDEAIEQITGRKPSLARAPYGALPLNSEAEMKRLYIGWTVDPLDWMTEDAGQVVNAVVGETEPGDIILLHDCYSSSVQAALRIVDLLQGRGYEFVTADRLLMD